MSREGWMMIAAAIGGAGALYWLWGSPAAAASAPSALAPVPAGQPTPSLGPIPANAPGVLNPSDQPNVVLPPQGA